MIIFTKSLITEEAFKEALMGLVMDLPSKIFSMQVIAHKRYWIRWCRQYYNRLRWTIENDRVDLETGQRVGYIDLYLNTGKGNRFRLHFKNGDFYHLEHVS